MLGTGHRFIWNLYNTCFLLENESEKILVDIEFVIKLM